MENKFVVKPQTLDHTIKQIVEAIDKGYELQELPGDEDLEEEKRLEYSDCIILKPFYQRDYRASVEDESSLIESVFVGIPIPPVFLTSTRYRGVQVLDVVDGQHRLNAFYRYRKNSFSLKELPLLSEFEHKKFRDLDIEEQEELIRHKLPAYVFREFPGKKFELEVFNRYNKGTKTLTPQEIRHAVYSSPYNDYVNLFVKSMNESGDTRLKDAYNVTKDRYLKKKVQEGVFTILWILEYGIEESFKDSTVYAEEYMKRKAELYEYEEQGESAQRDLENTKETFAKFNDWVLTCAVNTKYPFSKELYGISSKSYKFQTSMAMILAAIYRKVYILNEGEQIDNNALLLKIQYELSNSFLENPMYNASSTNSREIKRLVEEF